MKKISLIFILLYLCVLLLFLTGCSGGSLYAGHQDLERLLPIQTLGIDTSEGTIALSVSAGISEESGQPLVLHTAAAGIEAAIQQLQEYSPRDELYYAHVQYVLVGQEAAETDLEGILRWVERSPDMRMGTAIFIMKGSAAQAVITASDGLSDVTEQLASLEREARLFGRHIYSLREISSSLAEESCSLCLTIETVSTQGTVYADDASASALLPAGYAVLQDGVLIGFLSQEESLGADLLAGCVSGSRVIVEGNTLDLIDGSVSVHGQWGKAGDLEGLVLQGSLRAGILEQDAGCETDLNRLDHALGETAGQWLSQAVVQSQALNCDFLSLGNAVDKDSPKGFSLDEWENIFPTLPITVEIEGEVDRSYDLAQ
ncbi:MAG: hypothetical protein LUE22_08730 [Oscillospiraceae bacterium]|nr:hypothetical protein [Oscillospiraceae bacterium]